MKTIKITEDTHQKLLELQTKNYKKHGIKLTLSDTIASLFIMLEMLQVINTESKRQYNFNDGEHNGDK